MKIGDLVRMKEDKVFLLVKGIGIVVNLYIEDDTHCCDIYWAESEEVTWNFPDNLEVIQ